MAVLFYKVVNFCDFTFTFLHTKSLLKWVFSDTKEFAPKGKKFILFKVYPFSEGRQNHFDRVVFTGRMSLLLNYTTSRQQID